MSKKLAEIRSATKYGVFVDGGKAGWAIEPESFENGKAGLGEPRPSIPDNSDSSSYFKDHHIDVSVGRFGGKWDFSFWNDDWDDYKIKYCRNEDWKNTTTLMRGGDKGGNGTPIVLHVSEHPLGSGTYELTAVAITEDENRKEIATSFKHFKDKANVSAAGNYSSDKVHKLMKHPKFLAAKRKASDSGYGSIGLIWGKEKGAIVGKESFSGFLVGMEEEGIYEIKSTAYSVGVEEGEVLFVGLYMSTEPPSKVGGLDFFAEVAVDVEDVGFAFKLFTNFWSGAGFMVMLTDGEELEVSVGMGDTSVKKIV